MWPVRASITPTTRVNTTIAPITQCRMLTLTSEGDSGPRVSAEPGRHRALFNARHLTGLLCHLGCYGRTERAVRYDQGQRDEPRQDDVFDEAATGVGDDFLNEFFHDSVLGWVDSRV